MILFLSGGGVNWEQAVKSGIKVHTVRRNAKGIKPGSLLQLVVDRFLSSRRTVLETACASVQDITISSGLIIIDGRELPPADAADFSMCGGFESVEQMLRYYGDGFSGVIIHWTKKRY